MKPTLIGAPCAIAGVGNARRPSAAALAPPMTFNADRRSSGFLLPMVVPPCVCFFEDGSIDRYDGTCPATLDLLLRLPGVGKVIRGHQASVALYDPGPRVWMGDEIELAGFDSGEHPR